MNKIITITILLLVCTTTVSLAQYINTTISEEQRVTQQRLIITGIDGKSSLTTDGGRTWKPLDINATTPNQRLIITGIDGKSSLTTDGGRTWKPVDVNATHSQRLIITGIDGKSSLTTDGGRTWKPTDIQNNIVNSGVKNSVVSTGLIVDGGTSYPSTTITGLQGNPSDTYQITICDMYGTNVMESHGTLSGTVTIPQLMRGVYVLRCSSGDVQTTRLLNIQ